MIPGGAVVEYVASGMAAVRMTFVVESGDEDGDIRRHAGVLTRHTTLLAVARRARAFDGRSGRLMTKFSGSGYLLGSAPRDRCYGRPPLVSFGVCRNHVMGYLRRT